MKRNVDINEISDGRLYSANDMVKVGCGDCKGCSACCRGMGDSIILDPYDVYRLAQGTGSSFMEMMAAKQIELSVHDSVILPSLALAGEGQACSFLNEEGRCSIHEYRPGVCRLFPLGRIYREDGFDYFLQVKECAKENRTKVKVKKWIDTPGLAAYERYIMMWHDFIANLTKRCEGVSQEEQKELNMKMLNDMYITPYRLDEDFYEQFNERITQQI